MVSDEALGWFGSFVAVFMFGTQTIFVKPKILTEFAQMQANVVVLSYSFGIFLFGLVLFIVLASGGVDPSLTPPSDGGWPTPLTWEGFAQAWAFGPAKLLLIFAVRGVGVAVSGAVVAGVFSTLAWIIGVTALGEQFESLAVGGIIVFLCGVLGMSYVKYHANGSLMDPCRKWNRSSNNRHSTFEDAHEFTVLDDSSNDSSNAINADPQRKQPKSFFGSQTGGLLLSFGSGFFFSLQGIPLHYSPKGAALENAATLYIMNMPIMLLFNIPIIIHTKRTRGLRWIDRKSVV